MINGVLNVWKEAGFTSHDVVAKLRGILHQKKIGHTGTLDPDATGVLPVCIGKGTRLCDMLTDETKTYEALLHRGIETDERNRDSRSAGDRDGRRGAGLHRLVCRGEAAGAADVFRAEG